MRRFVIVSLAIAALLAITSPASAARLRAYRGETSAGTEIAFVIRRADDGRMSMKEMFYQAELVCEDSTTLDYFSWWGFGGVGIRLEGRSLTFDHTFWSEALHIAGVFRAQTADGTYKNTQATLTDTEQAQLCTTGDLTWTANRVALDQVAGLDSSRSADVVHRVNGGRVRAISRSALNRAGAHQSLQDSRRGSIRSDDTELVFGDPPRELASGEQWRR